MTLAGHTDSILTVAFSPDGSLLASGCRDGSIHLWDPTDGKHTISLIGNALFAEPPYLPRRQDDPPYITARGRDAVSFRLFSVLMGARLQMVIRVVPFTSGICGRTQIKSTFSGQSGLNALAFSPDGRTLASGKLGDGDDSDMGTGAIAVTGVIIYLMLYQL